MVRYFFVSFSIIVMGFVMVFEWDALFPDRRDYQILTPQPLRLFIVFAAKATALAGKLGITPENSAVSQSLLAGARTARAALEPLQGTAFDEGYIAREVAFHQAVLDALDTLLIPTTSNAELKQLLVSVRPAIAAHLAHAQMLQKSLVAAK